MTQLFRVLLLGLLLLGPAAVRAETHATCTGFIESVPTIISTQGTWCMRHDLSTALASGTAVLVATNNVTIDCNQFKLGGLAAGAGSLTVGIRATSRDNVTVRNCNVRGFFIGVQVTSGGGHLIEDNRIDNSLMHGIFLSADGGLTRRNRVIDTGGAPGEAATGGIVATGDILDNVVTGVIADAEHAFPDGIAQYSGSGGVIQGNRISGLVTTGAGTARGISASGANTRIQANHITATAMTTGIGVYAGGDASFCLENTVSNFLTPFHQCELSAANYGLPAP